MSEYGENSNNKGNKENSRNDDECLEFKVDDNGPALTVIAKRWYSDVCYNWYKEEWQADFTIGIKSPTFPDFVKQSMSQRLFFSLLFLRIQTPNRSKPEEHRSVIFFSWRVRLAC